MVFLLPSFLLHFFPPLLLLACWSVLVGVTSSAPAHTQRVVRASDATVIHLHTYSHTHSHRHRHTHICKHTYTYMPTHTNIHTHTHTCLTFIHSYISPPTHQAVQECVKLMIARIVADANLKQAHTYLYTYLHKCR